MVHSRVVFFYTFLGLMGSLANVAVCSGGTIRNSLVKRPVVTYAKDIAPILYSKCSSCHHQGEVAPFSLVSYADARRHNKELAEVVKSGIMPPWKADSHGEFKNERKLSSEEKALIVSWSAAGAPQGDPSKQPAAPKFVEGWRYGKPDEVIRLPEPYHLEAEGRDDYRCFVIPNTSNVDRYISEMEFKPDNRKVVHHVIAYLDTSGAARKLDEKDPGPGYRSTGGGPGFIPSAMLGGWAPGNAPGPLPDGIGIPLPKGSDIVLEMHYHKSGKPEIDQTSVGISYCKKPVDKRLRLLAVVAGVSIPADATDHITNGTASVMQDITAYDVTPHMHLLGKKIKVSVEMSDGSNRQLVNVVDWDFNWQIEYIFREPIKIPAGAKFKITASYDNSSGNPRNPNNPPKRVTWGEQTTDEMCIAFIGFTADNESLLNGKKVGKVSFMEIGNGK